jgi:hypothetical protein
MTHMLNANLNLMSRIGNWIDFPDYDDPELLEISSLLARQYGLIPHFLDHHQHHHHHHHRCTGYTYPDEAKQLFLEYMNLRKEFPYFSNARTVCS